MEFLRNRIIHDFFLFTIILKGINGVWEIALGLAFLVFGRQTLSWAAMAVHQVFAGSSGRLAGAYLQRQAENVSPGTQYFLAVYFLFYGLVNFFLVAALFRRKHWAYPVAIVFFSLFIVYQFWRVYLHHSGLLFWVTVFDIFLVWPIYLEYKNVKKAWTNS